MSPLNGDLAETIRRIFFAHWKMTISRPIYGNHLQETTKSINLGQLPYNRMFHQANLIYASSL